jgi:peptidyl-tRNA hydrolase, PTH1 family
MKLIVGLGNPGLRYAHTRHNAGFDTADLIAARHSWSWDAKRGKSLLASGMIGGEKVTLAKPQTYMNDSGFAVADLVHFYKLPLADLLILCDDLDLPLDKIRLRPGGSAGGQHGLEDTIRHLGANGFARIKIGIGRPAHGRAENVDFLLSAPRGDERAALDAACERAADAALCWVTSGVLDAMNRYNA